MSENNDCVLGARNEQRIKGLEARMITVEQGITEIKDTLLSRPTWTVMTIITILSSLCVGLIVRMFAR